MQFGTKSNKEEAHAPGRNPARPFGHITRHQAAGALPDFYLTAAG